MSCLSLIFLRDLLVWLVILCAVVAILRVVIPWALQKFAAEGGIVAQVLNIILWAIIVIAVLYVIFMLLSCLVGGGFSILPPTPHR